MARSRVRQGAWPRWRQVSMRLASRAKTREPTGVASAGLNHDADTPLIPEWLQWADLIFVMEPAHRKKLAQRFRAHLHGQRVVCRHIPDEYDFMDPALVALLRARVPPYLDRP